MAYLNTQERPTRDLFLYFLIIKLCKWVDIPKKDNNTLEECDVAYNLWRGRVTQGGYMKKIKIGEKGKSSRASESEDSKIPSIQAPTSLGGWDDDLVDI